MNNSDVIGLAISYAYAISLLLIAEGLGRFFQIPAQITRKFIHISAGMWSFGVLFLFHNWQFGIIPFASFILVNFFLYRYRIVKSMDTEDSSPGTIYFAFSITLLFALLWRPLESTDNVAIAMCGVMAMTWGDAFAALIGKRFGKYQYQVWVSTRTYEGSAVMFFVSFLAIFLVLFLIPGSLFSSSTLPYSWHQILLGALVGGAAVTLVEAVSPHGTDNLTVPLVGSTVVWCLINFL
jgi:phytol kinase